MRSRLPGVPADAYAFRVSALSRIVYASRGAEGGAASAASYSRRRLTANRLAVAIQRYWSDI